MFDHQTSQQPQVNAAFAPKLAPLFQPARYKVLYGGRNAGRSWGVARALLIMGYQRKLRVLCARELQTSIAESVHKLLSDQIFNLGLESFFDIQRDRIIGANDTSFFFDGIKNNVKKIKSYEGIDVCWVEEAADVSEASWEILTPTIRKDGSEIWMTFNPGLEDDYTYKRFVLDPDEGSIVIKMTYQDNPWVTPQMVKEAESLRQRDPDAYLNVWMGECRQMLKGVVFAKQMRAASEDGRICKVRWDRETPVDVWMDLGRRDATAMWFGQRVGMENRFLHYYEATGEDIWHYLRYAQGLEYTYGTWHLPHDAKAQRLGSKRTIEEIVRASGKSVRIVPRLRKADQINAGRTFLASCWFDQLKCADGLKRLRGYRFKVKDGKFSEEPDHDENSHGADAFMQAAVSMGHGERSPEGIASKFATAVTRNLEKMGRSPLGWMGQ